MLRAFQQFDADNSGYITQVSLVSQVFSDHAGKDDIIGQQMVTLKAPAVSHLSCVDS